MRLLLLGLLLLVGCATRSNDFATLGYDAADALASEAKSELPSNAPIVYSVFTPAGQPDRSSPFGRMFAEQVTSGLAHQGFKVVELRLREAIAVRQGGPYALSDDYRDVAPRTLARAVLVGSYALTGDSYWPARSYVMITVRLVDAASGVVLSSWDKSVALSRADEPLFQSAPN